MLREMLDSLHEKKLAYGCRSVSRGEGGIIRTSGQEDISITNPEMKRRLGMGGKKVYTTGMIHE